MAKCFRETVFLMREKHFSLWEFYKYRKIFYKCRKIY